ncbi:hypothetical protein LguiA_031852 [Lonicera macranthoides]
MGKTNMVPFIETFHSICDKIFHLPQAQQYFKGNFSRLDPIITTPPGLHLEEKPSGQRGKEPAKGVIPFGKMPKEGKSKMGRKDKRRECFSGTVLRGIWNEWNRIFQLIGMADVATLTLVVAIDITCLKKKYALVINHLYGSTLSYNVVIIDTPSVPN